MKNGKKNFNCKSIVKCHVLFAISFNITITNPNYKYRYIRFKISFFIYLEKAH